MPELPEVETTRKGIEPHLLQQRIKKVIIRQSKLRWPIPATLKQKLKDQIITRISRRAKYLLMQTPAGTVLLHLGMSGSLRIIPAKTPADKHDHVDFVLANNQCLRLHDPRRFGAVLWAGKDPNKHPLICNLGPEPWDNMFNGDYLFNLSRGRKKAIKNFIMDGHVVVGIGNIYASEALFHAGIHPQREAGRISRIRYQRLAENILSILEKAIQAGGTSLKDFVREDGTPGYFKQELRVYGREHETCYICSSRIKRIIIGQRSSFYCSKCQH